VTTAVVAALVADLAAEKSSLATVLAERPASDWDRPTPAPGWAIRDQIAHLAHFDGVTRLAVADPEAFMRLRDGLGDLQHYVDDVGARQAHRDAAELLAWWEDGNAGLRAAATAADPVVRVPWFGPPMSLASKLTARIMETWAHGQDVVDALGVTRPPTERLRHVARIGVLALPNSFRAHELPVPSAPVRVELLAPDGVTRWDWGDETAADRVHGPAEDFCLVVTQRRHVEDTALTVVGGTARSWMSVAQAFAGPPGPGRRPGQFSR